MNIDMHGPLKYLRSFVTYLAFHFILLPAYSQESKQGVFPLKSLSLSSDVNWLDDIFKERISPDVTCVGLGEFTHGGHETMAFKSKMIQYLVSRKGYRRILIEYPNVLLRNLNSYLLDVSVKDTLVASQKVKNTFGYNLNDLSFVELIQWLKIYNLDNKDKPISFVGIDIEGSLTTFADYFNENFVPLIDSAQELGFPRKFTSDQRHSVSIAQLKWLNKNRELLRNKVDSISYQELIFNAKAAQDKLTHITKQGDNEYVAGAYRDSIMAENVLAQTSTKTMLWSHNIHTTTSDFVINLGNYLKPELRKRYYSILTDFSESAKVWVIGSGGLLVKKGFLADKKSTAYIINKRFKISSGIVFYEKLKTGKNKAKFNDIDMFGGQRVVGSGRTFDVLVFFDNVHPSMHQ